MNTTELLDYTQTDNFKSLVGMRKAIDINNAVESLNKQEVNARVSNDGYVLFHKIMAEKIGRMLWILQVAVDSEEKHYNDEDTKPGWFYEATQLIEEINHYQSLAPVTAH